MENLLLSYSPFPGSQITRCVKHEFFKNEGKIKTVKEKLREFVISRPILKEWVSSLNRKKMKTEDLEFRKGTTEWVKIGIN